MNQLCGKDTVHGHRGGEGLDDRTSPHCAYLCTQLGRWLKLHEVRFNACIGLGS